MRKVGEKERKSERRRWRGAWGKHWTEGKLLLLLLKKRKEHQASVGEAERTVKRVIYVCVYVLAKTSATETPAFYTYLRTRNQNKKKKKTKKREWMDADGYLPPLCMCVFYHVCMHSCHATLMGSSSNVLAPTRSGKNQLHIWRCGKNIIIEIDQPEHTIIYKQGAMQSLKRTEDPCLGFCPFVYDNV